MLSNPKDQVVNGWLNLDKPLGLSSSQAVNRVRRALFAKKAGHGGTLDPLATGVLPIALGEATKTSAYAMDHTKIYHFGIFWGEARTTDDREGQIMEFSDHRPSERAIRQALTEFTGIIEQTPPRFSAIKVNGQRAYKIARRDEVVNLKARCVSIDKFSLINVINADRASFSVTCGKGTYVRSLARDLAKNLGTVGHVDWLRRIAVGPFDESHTISLDKIESLGHIAARSRLLMPVETVLDDIPALAVTAREAERLKHGRSVSTRSMVGQSILTDIEHGDTVCAMSEGKLVALVRIHDGDMCPFRVLNL